MTHYYTFLHITGMSWLIQFSPHLTFQTHFLHSRTLISVLIHYRDETRRLHYTDHGFCFRSHNSDVQALRATSQWTLQMENVIFCDVKPCWLTGVLNFSTKRAAYILGSKSKSSSMLACLLVWLPLRPWIWSWTSLPKHRKTCTELQSINFEKIVFLTLTTVRTTNPMLIGFPTHLIKRVQSVFQNSIISVEKLIVNNKAPTGFSKSAHYQRYCLIFIFTETLKIDCRWAGGHPGDCEKHRRWSGLTSTCSEWHSYSHKT